MGQLWSTQSIATSAQFLLQGYPRSPTATSPSSPPRCSTRETIRCSTPASQPPSSHLRGTTPISSPWTISRGLSENTDAINLLEFTSTRPISSTTPSIPGWATIPTWSSINLSTSPTPIPLFSETSSMEMRCTLLKCQLFLRTNCQPTHKTYHIFNTDQPSWSFQGQK